MTILIGFCLLYRLEMCGFGREMENMDRIFISTVRSFGTWKHMLDSLKRGTSIKIKYIKTALCLDIKLST